ncbi:CHASE2 domain-containing protein, partial [bacterium]|nr:CHASE2 domain-containing protein [bacterium]
MRRLLALLRNVFQAGRGRPAAVGLLAAVLLGVALFPDLPPLRSGRLALFDSYQTWLPRQRVSQEAEVVEIDEATLGALGQWPWPRTYVAALIDAIAAAQPAAIGLDMYFPEADHSSPESLAEFRTDLNAATRKALAQLPSNDRILAASLRQAPTVLGVAGFS